MAESHQAMALPEQAQHHPLAQQSAEPSRDRALRRNAGVEKSKRSRDIRNRPVHDAIYYRESHWQSRVLRKDLH